MSRLRKSAAAGALAVSLVTGFEGMRLTAYRDSVGVPTLCIGETLNVRMGQHATVAQCDAMLVKRLDEFADSVEKCVTRPMPDKVEAAFVSLAYNVGSGAFCRSTTARLYNAGDRAGACDAMMRFDMAGGKVLPGLARRRASERTLCLEGIR